MSVPKAGIRILFLGQKPIGERGFELLLEAADSGLVVCGAVSNVSTDAWWGSNRIFRHCRERGIPFLDNRTRQNRPIRDLIETGRADLLLSVQHPWIVPAETIAAVGGRAFNLHNARLPDYRGYNSCNHAILDGAGEYACTLHWMAAGVDEGDRLLERAFPIDPADTALSLFRKAEEAALELLRRFIGLILAGEGLPRQPLGPGGRFYPRSSLDAVRRIENPADPIEVDRKARGLFFPPFEPAYLEIGGRRYYLLPEDLLNGSYQPPAGIGSRQ